MTYDMNLRQSVIHYWTALCTSRTCKEPFVELITSIYTCTYMSHFKTQTIYCSVKKEGCMVDHSTSDILMQCNAENYV